MTTSIVKTAKESDKASVIEALKLAFVSDPAIRWVWSDTQKYLSNFSRFIKAFGGKAFEYNSAHFIGSYYGVALWLPPNVFPDVEEMISLLQSSGSEDAKRDGLEVFEKMSSYHPDQPHYYLPLLGVDPFHHGKGIGSILLQHAIVMFDLDNKFAYLESSNPKSIPFYKRHGFELLGTIQVKTSPPIFPMLRTPTSISR